VDRFGRRPLLLAGFAIQSLALLILASLTTSFFNNDNTPAAVVEVVMLFIVGLTYCWSNGPIPPAIASEIFPQHVRDKAFGLSLIGQAACLLALTQPWPRFSQEVGGRSYWLLFSLNATALISVYFILPETKGITLERMEKIFGQIDYVEAGERETQAEKIEAITVSHAMGQDIQADNTRDLEVGKETKTGNSANPEKSTAEEIEMTSATRQDKEISDKGASPEVHSG